MLNLNTIGIEIFIKRFKSNSEEAFWNNYDLVIWKKDSGGFTNKNGMFRKNSWGTIKTIPVDNKGIWKLPKKYVKHFK